MPSGNDSTRDRLLDAAIALFASQGYASTTVADIQQACGLSPSSGALYRHFESKNALLLEATRRQVSRMMTEREEHERTRPADAGEALRRGAERIWDGVNENTNVFRLMFREPEAIEDFADELWSAVTSTAYQTMSTALATAKRAGSSRVDDSEATGAVLLAALTYFPIMQLLIGHTPGNVEADRYLQAWLRLAESVFTGTTPT